MKKRIPVSKLNFKVVPAVAIVFNNKNEILLAQRHYKNDPRNRYHGAWGFPGGGIEIDEQPTKTAARETEEETGIKIKILSERPIVMSCVEQTGNHVIKLGYVSRYIGGKINTSKDDGTNDAGWFSISQIKSLNTTLLTKEMVIQAFGLLKSKKI